MNRPVRQLGALVLAAALVVGAIVIRQRIDGNGQPSSDGGSGAAITLVCDPLMADACKGVPNASVTVEGPAVTAERLIAREPLGADAWVTSDLWTSIAADRLSGSAWLADGAKVLGAANPILVGQAARLDPLAAHCGADPLTWRCVGDNAGKTWSDVGVPNLNSKIDIGYPLATTTIGLADVTAIVSSYFKGTDFATNDLDDDDFRSWYSRLQSAVADHGSASQTPLQRFLQVPATYGVVGDLSTSKPSISAIAAAATLSVVDSTPAIRVRAVIVSPTRTDLPTDRLSELLGPTWNADSDTGSLPAGGVLSALSEL